MTGIHLLMNRYFTTPDATWILSTRDFFSDQKFKSNCVIKMNHSIKYCLKEYPEAVIKISAQQYLIKFYTELGFKTIGEGYLEDDIPHIAMIYDQHILP